MRTTARFGDLHLGMFIELLAARAQDYLAREGIKQFGIIPTFDADPRVVEKAGQRMGQARASTD